MSGLWNFAVGKHVGNIAGFPIVLAVIFCLLLFHPNSNHSLQYQEKGYMDLYGLYKNEQLIIFGAKDAH